MPILGALSDRYGRKPVLLFGETEVRSGHLVVGWLKTTHGADAVLLMLVGLTFVAAVAVTLFAWRVRRLGIRL